ncbi:MAG: TetR/AcrR family transcriptional regulator [Chloroflexota bacterium]|nr:TetR/AcrR family transcriptional regulator [Chloroflexota bacterium]
MAGKRKYELQRRAERQEETRRRIAAATAELHEEVGPANTTISAVAARAGVERVTVYRHFPDEADLLRACQQHFLTAHPPPNPDPWLAISDPEQRLRSALQALYAYFRETEAMTANVLRDASSMPVLAEVLGEMSRYVSSIREMLALGWPDSAPDAGMLIAAIGHAIDFETWRSLVRRQGLTDERAIEVMVKMVRSVSSVAESGSPNAGNRPEGRR